MVDLIKKTLLAGVGLTLLTADKVEEVARDIAKSAQLSTDKGQEFVKEAVERARKGRAELEATVQRMVQQTLQKANLATRDDIAELRSRLERLEQQVAGRSS